MSHTGHDDATNNHDSGVKGRNSKIVNLLKGVTPLSIFKVREVLESLEGLRDQQHAYEMNPAGKKWMDGWRMK